DPLTRHSAGRKAEAMWATPNLAYLASPSLRPACLPSAVSSWPTHALLRGRRRHLVLSPNELLVLDQRAQAIIRKKARQLARRPSSGPSARDDLEQELTLRLLPALHDYDPTQGFLHGFVKTVVDRCAANMLREARAEKRGRGRIASLSVRVATREGPAE